MVSVWSAPALLSKQLGVLEAGQTVKVTAYKTAEKFYQVQFKGGTGYIDARDLKRNEALDRLIEQAGKGSEAKPQPEKPSSRRRLSPADEAAKQKVLTMLYGEKIASRIMQGKVWKGMTKEMVIQSLGEPKSVKRSVFSNVIKEQWEYEDGTLLFFDNDTLAAYGGPPREIQPNDVPLQFMAEGNAVIESVNRKLIVWRHREENVTRTSLPVDEPDMQGNHALQPGSARWRSGSQLKRTDRQGWWS